MPNEYDKQCEERNKASTAVALIEAYAKRQTSMHDGADHGVGFAVEAASAFLVRYFGGEKKDGQ